MNLDAPIICEYCETLVAGKTRIMSLVKDETALLWKSFMTEKSGLKNRSSNNYLSLQVYPHGYFNRFDPNRTFTKWACAPIADIESIPASFSFLKIPAGLYAMFRYRGSATNAQQVFAYIFGEWIAASTYEIDDRPHFEVIGNKYIHNDENSEEEIWIPIRKRL